MPTDEHSDENEELGNDTEWSMHDGVGDESNNDGIEEEERVLPSTQTEETLSETRSQDPEENIFSFSQERLAQAPDRSTIFGKTAKIATVSAIGLAFIWAAVRYVPPLFKGNNDTPAQGYDSMFQSVDNFNQSQGGIYIGEPAERTGSSRAFIKFPLRFAFEDRAMLTGILADRRLQFSSMNRVLPLEKDMYDNPRHTVTIQLGLLAEEEKRKKVETFIDTALSNMNPDAPANFVIAEDATSGEIKMMMDREPFGKPEGPGGPSDLDPIFK